MIIWIRGVFGILANFLQISSKVTGGFLQITCKVKAVI